MEFNDYQEKIVKFDTFTVENSHSVINFALLDKILGLTGESGEVADKVKKLLRDKNGLISPEDKLALSKELGDVLWYLATCARYLGLSFDEIAVENITKLESRLARGKIAGNGDER
jgi:NTP pyrophosphatase (non-canonical NTP hydrolase)